jgi:hypothetical protein
MIVTNFVNKIILRGKNTSYNDIVRCSYKHRTIIVRPSYEHRKLTMIVQPSYEHRTWVVRSSLYIYFFTTQLIAFAMVVRGSYKPRIITMIVQPSYDHRTRVATSIVIHFLFTTLLTGLAMIVRGSYDPCHRTTVVRWSYKGRTMIVQGLYDDCTILVRSSYDPCTIIVVLVVSGVSGDESVTPTSEILRLTSHSAEQWAEGGHRYSSGEWCQWWRIGYTNIRDSPPDEPQCRAMRALYNHCTSIARAAVVREENNDDRTMIVRWLYNHC